LTEQTSRQPPRLNADASRCLRVESDFLAGVEANLESAKGRHLRGERWQTVRDDESDALRAAMARKRMYDRELLKELPHNRRVVIHGSERRWWFWTRKTGVAIASVIAPLEHLLSPESATAPPVTLSELADHVRRLVGEAKVPHLVGVCSPSGFDSEALDARLDLPHVTLVLVEPRQGGGWKVHSAQEKLPEEILRLFDPEELNQKLARVQQEIEDRRAELLTGSLSARAIAERLGLSERVVAWAFERTAAADPEIRLTRRSGEVLLYRGAPSPMKETGSMNVVERIRQLFSREGDEAQKINLLSERRAALARQRDRIYEDIGKLEKREGELLQQGRATESQVTRRRLAAQLAQLRKDIARQNTAANMLNQQVNIISTDIHNLTLIQQGQVAQLPATEELTQNAVRAEEMLETLRADADLVSNLETGIADVATTTEELAILKEFEQPSAEAAEAPRAVKQDAKRATEKFEEPQREKDRPAADPEA
jgi:hypothetical protein